MGLGARWHGAEVPRRQPGRGGSLGTVLRAVWRTLIFATVGNEWTLSGYMGVVNPKNANF